MDKHALLKSYYQPDEKLLLAKVLDQADLSLKKKSVSYSDFLDPTMTAKAIGLLKQIREVHFSIFGGYDDAERCIIAMYPDYFDDDDLEYPIKTVEIKHNAKFSSKLSHRDYLGSILGLGIERTKIGDIIVLDDAAYCFAESSIADYICVNLEKIGHTKVKSELSNVQRTDIFEKKMDLRNTTVSSLRADTVFGVVFAKSRSEVQDLIRGRKASINWIEIDSVSLTLNEGDVLSLKGSGRGKLVEVIGTTKKGKISIIVGRYV